MRIRDGRRRPAVPSFLNVVLGAVIFVALNIVADGTLRGLRLDLTEERRFTISDGTINVIGSLEEPIRLKLYFSRRLARQVPVVMDYGRRVQELLERYVRSSRGMIRLEVIDPEPLGESEDEADLAGLRPVPLDTGTRLYFGLVGSNTTGGREVVPFLRPEKEPFLEYDLTRLVHGLTDPDKPVVGLITGHPMNAGVTGLARLTGQGPPPWAIVDLIRERFELEVVEAPRGSIADRIDVLLVVHPTGLDDAALYAIDQFVMRGGRAVVYVDPHSEVAASAGGAGGGRAGGTRSSLERLLNAWGASVDPDKVVADFTNARRVRSSVAGQERVVPYLPWLRVGPEYHSSGDVVSRELAPLVFASAGSIAPTGSATTRLAPLVTTSRESMRLDVEAVSAGPDPRGLIERFEADGEAHVLVARITGTAPSAFPDGPPAAPVGGAGDAAAGPPPVHLAASARPVNLVVVSDSDTLFDPLWQQRQSVAGQEVAVPVAGNGDLLVNALDHLAGSDDLIGLRTRGKSSRPLLVVEALRRDAERRFLERERAIRAELNEAQAELAELESRAPSEGGMLLGPEQRGALDRVRGEIRAIRRALGDVQRELHRDTERLEARVKLFNIGLVPAVVAIVAPLVAGVRVRRRRRRAGAGRPPSGTRIGYPRAHPVLVAVTVAVLVLAAWTVVERERENVAEDRPELLFPDLRPRVNDVVAVEVRGPGGAFTIARGEDGAWTIPEKHGYPVRFATVRKAVVGVAGLVPLEAQTEKPGLHGKLGLARPGEEGEGVVVALRDAEGRRLAAVVAGRERFSGTETRPGRYFVRREGENRAWLVEGRLQASGRAARWLDPALPRLDRREVRAIRTEKADGEVIELARDAPERLDFRMEGAVTVSGPDLARGALSLPPGTRILRETAVSELVSALEYLTFEDVAPASDVDLAGGTLAEYTTFDGLVVGVRVKRVAGAWWARFHARFDPGRAARESRNESEAINARFGGWAYRLPDHKGEDLVMRREALLVDVPAAEGRGG